MAVKVAVADYGCGNIKSVVNALNVVGAEVHIAKDASELALGDKIILPGVGAFREAMEHLHTRDFIGSLKDEVFDKGKDILGICLGMQLLCRGSDEGGDIPGLAWVDADVKHFNSLGLQGLKVPHMGWNELMIQRSHTLVGGIDQCSDVYFVHSHAVQCDHLDDVLTYTDYGVKFVSSFAKDNIFGMQFHPEKSHKVGLHILKNFVEA